MMFKPTLFLALLLLSAGPVLAARPNIVWIVVDDMSSHFGYQGEPLARTPNVDQLAREGVVFSQAYATAPVCSTFRSALITGIYQTSIGAHHHRSSRGEHKIALPGQVKTVPEMFRAAGYYTTNADASGGRWGKEDYNFIYNRSQLYDGFDYRDRKQDQPFFAQFQLRGGKLRNVDKWYEEAKSGLNGQLVDRSQVKLPPYYPNHPVIREDWAQYLDAVNYTDVEVGRILERLRADGVLDNTIVFFLTDHGISHARGKQFLYEEGILIPFVVWAPPGVELESAKSTEGVERDDLIAHIDLAATSLQLAGVQVPDWMEGRPLFGDRAKARNFVVSARDRCDETVDRIRSVRAGNFKYIRNDYPQRPYLQPCAYKDAKPFMPVLREWFAAGKLNPAQSLHLADSRPREELYDLTSDPWEIHNLAADPAYAQRLASMRATLEAWEVRTNDQGRTPESESVYDSEMAAYLRLGLRKRDPDYAAEVERNIRVMKAWQAAGK
ncbi:sulfatase family protein [Roseimaritima ulvae]|uniref:Arylsulfatase n=1 Tax=Roseimaritima ulvae TaxID=980254 RepID=A0A5B9RA03_9BACT|nr:sulfatase [Roseimaritima ulvae]QEG43703.1 Arylsulfatase [Roseimaritima ulvae]